jgi:hypothetical protein
MKKKIKIKRTGTEEKVPESVKKVTRELSGTHQRNQLTDFMRNKIYN